MEETEIKLELLSDNPNTALERILGPAEKIVEQLNRYFLPAAPQGTVVRCREEEGRVVLSVKGQSRVKEGFFRRSELSQPIPPEWLLDLIDHGDQTGLLSADVMQNVSGPLIPAGQNRNTRRIWHWRGWVLELDETTFPDGSISWELEVETATPLRAKEELYRLLQEAGIRWVPATLGKFERTRKKQPPPDPV